MIVGRSNYLDGVEFSEACDRYEEGKGKLKIGGINNVD